MPKKSVKENKTVYQIAREEAELTRAAASEKMQFVSEDRIEKIEYETSPARPDEVLAMSKAYNKPELCNYYCSHDCQIGQEYVPHVEVKDFSRATLEMLSVLNAMDKDKNRLIEIAADSKVTEDELPDFLAIKDNLEKISVAVEALQLWFEKEHPDVLE